MAAETTAVRPGFPTRLGTILRRYLYDNPVVLLELRRSLRQRKLEMICLLNLLVTGIILAVTVLYSGAQQFSEVMRNFPDIMLGIELVVICLLAPGLAANTIPRERELRIDDDIRRSALTPGERVAGQITVVVAFLGLNLLLPLPYFCLSFLYGGFSPVTLVAAYLVLFAAAVAAAAAGVLAGSESATVKHAGGRAGLAVIFCLLPAVLAVGSLLSPQPWTEIVPALAAILFCLLLAALLAAVAREQLADWGERGRYLRPVIIAAFIMLALLPLLAGLTGTFSRDDFRFTFSVLIYAHWLAMFLLGVQAPRPEQLWRSLPEAAGAAQCDLWRENPLSALRLLGRSLAGFGLCFTLLGLAWDTATALHTLAATVVGLSVLALYFYVGRLVAFLFRLRYLLGGSLIAALFIVGLIPLFCFSLLPIIFGITGKWLACCMPLTLISTNLAGAGGFFNAAACLLLNILLAAGAAMAYRLLWRHRQAAGNYHLRDVYAGK